MERLEDKYSVKLDAVIKKLNALKNKGGALSTLQERIGLLCLGMGIIDKSANELVNFKEIHRLFNIPELVEYDYNLSDYAERFYVQANYVIEVLHKTSDSEFIKRIPIHERAQFYQLTERTLQISARWHIERMINVFEYDTASENKAFPKRKPLLEECIFFADRMNATKMGIKFKDGIMPRVLIFAVQPNAGKSFVANVYSLMSSCLHRLYFNTSGILRMSNNTANAIGFSNQIKSMIENEKIALIYPEFKKYFPAGGRPQILEKATAEEWKMQGLDPKIRASYFARGRDTAINSIRVFVALIIDDLSDGFDQMNNDDAHKDMTTKFEIDMDSRRESEDIPVFLCGTMFNEFDVPNQIIRKLEDAGLLFDNKKFRNVRNTEDYSVVVVAVDCFDDKGNSYAPKLISTAKLKEKQQALKPYEFDLVYRQVRASREPRIFDRQNLHQYDTMPENLSPTAIGVLDPNRKTGADFFSLPIFRENYDTKRSCFTDCIYEQKSLGKLNDPSNKFFKKVLKFLITNNVRELLIENNTSNTLGWIIEEKLKEQGFICKVREKFTNKIKGPKSSKLARILQQEATIVENIEFPAVKMYPPLHHISQFMEDFTRFDSKETSNKKQHDDAPDSMAIFSDNYLYNKSNRFASVKNPFSLKSLWKN